MPTIDQHERHEQAEVVGDDDAEAFADVRGSTGATAEHGRRRRPMMPRPADRHALARARGTPRRPSSARAASVTQSIGTMASIG